jgi:hypothetical protein
MRPCAPRRCIEWMGDNPPSKQIKFLGLLRVFMALKTLRCCGNSSLPEQRSALRAINTLNPPQNYIRKLGGLSPIHSMRRRRAQGLMWGDRGPFPPGAAMVVVVVTPVVFCAKATKKRNKNTKISWWLPKSLFITICYKTYCNSYIANSSVAQARVVAWLEPEPLWSNGPRHIGYRQKALVIARMNNALE